MSCKKLIHELFAIHHKQAINHPDTFELKNTDLFTGKVQ